MTPPSPRAFALFFDALDRNTDVREAWLAEACDDTDVRREVTALLTHHQTEDGLLDRPLIHRPPGEGSSEADPRIGQRIGVWRVTGLLGRGGMGSVYRASRDDGAYAQEAALKLGHPGMRPDFRARFLQERALLADLDHPGIARLLDGGLAPDGAPFLAMEVVDGKPLTDYAEAHALGLRQRLALFVQACEAVAYAHRSLVVHRDLKPDHILVASDEARDWGRADVTSDAGGILPLPSSPRVKLLDFGVAKLLEQESDVLTRTGMGPLTPAYAAPEQFLGRPVTTATDVYALGVVLYELLAGHRPYDVSTLTAAQAERVVCETAPARPSATPTSGTVRRTLSGDLDTICLKALAKEPARRYASAEALADDIRRYLDGLPVLARPATPMYHASRFVRRHRVSVAASGAVLVAAIALVAFYTVRLRAERDRAETASVEAREETDRAEAVAGFLEQILRSPNTRWYNDAEATGPDTPVRAVLDEAARRVDRDFADQPDLRADLHHTLGDTYLSLGLPDESRRHHLRSLALRESLYTPPHPKLAEALYYVSNAYLTRDAQGRTDHSTSLRLLERAVAMQRARNEGNNFPFMAQSLCAMYNDLGRYEEAAALAAEGLAFAQSRFVPGDEGFRYRGRILIFLAIERARAELGLGRLDAASRPLAFSDSVLAGMPRLAVNHDLWRAQMCALGRLRLQQRRIAESESALLACYGDVSPRATLSPIPAPEALDRYQETLLRGIAAPPLVALYTAQGRAPEAAPYRADAARALATRDSLRAVLRAAPARR